MDAQCKMEPVVLNVPTIPCFARLVRMTAANMAMLSSMSVERIEDIRMAAEEAFVYACSETPDSICEITFTVDTDHIVMNFELASDELEQMSEDTPNRSYADLLMDGLCDVYEKHNDPATLYLNLRADV